MIEFKYVTPFLTLLIGMLIGNILAIGRDKRKEYNEVVIPLKNKILKHIDSFDSKPDCDGLNKCDIETIRLCVAESLYRKIIKEHNEYTELMRQSITSDNWGVPYLIEEGNINILKKLNNINSMLKVR